MNKTFAISAIVLVAVIMGMSTVAPVYAQEDVNENAQNCSNPGQGEEKSGSNDWNCKAGDPSTAPGKP